MAHASDLDAWLEEEMADPEFRAGFAEVAPRVDFGVALAIARGQRRMSQKALAERAGIARGTLVRIESGDEAPTLATQVQLARALNGRIEFSASGRIDFVLFPQPVAHRIPAPLRDDISAKEKTA